MFGALCCLALLHVLLYPPFFGNSYSTPAIVLYELAALVAASLIFLRMRNSSGQDRRGWAVLLSAVISTGILDTLWSIFSRLNHGLPYPNWFDPFYLATYVLYIVAVGLLSSPLWRGRDRRWMFDAGALMAVSAGLLWHFVVPRTSDGSSLESAIGVAYLVLDLCFLGTVLSAVYTTRLTFRNGMILLAALTLAAGDAMYYFDAGAFDVSWLFGTWLLALAAAASPTASIPFPRVRISRPGVIPYVLVVVVGGITLLEMTRGRADELLLSGIVALALIVGRQILSLRQSLALQRSETAFREAVLEAQSELGLGMAILDGRRIVYANQAAERITGYSVEQLLGFDSFDDLIHGPETPEWALWLERPDVATDTTFTRPDGSIVDLEIVARRMGGPASSRLLLVARDVTARKQADHALAQAQKFEGLGALAGGVAHDFNNLLSTVLGNVGLLKMGELDEEADESVANIESAARRGAALTRSLLDFARIHPEHFAIEDLRECLLETASLARTALPVNVRLRIVPGPEPVFVRINRGQVIQAVLNLVLNARDAVGEEGEIHVALATRGDSAELSVRDSGSGMDEATLKRMFEPFFTTKTAGAGTGLGLAITQRTVREHGGRVTVESARGAGTTLTVVLPLATMAQAG